MNWLDAAEVYIQVRVVVALAIRQLFSIVNDVANAMEAPVTAAAAIYIALMGYSVLAGTITMSTRDLAVRFFKVVAIVVLLSVIGSYGEGFYNLLWEPIDDISNYMASKVAPLINIPSAGPITSLDTLAGTHAGLASSLSAQVAAAHSDNQTWGIMTWIIAMAPLIITIVAVYVAKFVSAALMVIAPFVFIAALILDNNKGQSILMTWVRLIAMTFLTVIIVYIVGVIGIVMVSLYSTFLIGTNALLGEIGAFTGDSGRYSLPRLAPMGILSLLSVVLVTQATTLAGGLLSVAGVNTQSAQSMLQISALSAAR